MARSQAGMKIVVHAVGRMKAGPEKDLADRFLDRLARSGPVLGLDFAGVVAIAESRAASRDERRTDEGRRLLAGLDAKAALVLLDERGVNLTSDAFATRLGGLRDAGRGTVVFAIGGADGHGDEVRGSAAFLWSFGALTWPHQLVRIMLAEQLYRATTILSGHPYHRV